MPGSGTRVEFIGPTRPPRVPYNWVEGSRYIEAIRGASTMRTDCYDDWQHEKFRMYVELQRVLGSLGL